VEKKRAANKGKRIILRLFLISVTFWFCLFLGSEEDSSFHYG